ncbi:hypothetical protein [Cochleicola gelatinilyticus]|uniref:Uncharacterized protein n=1 Tax=Cochleicola gelatinilyticus TaxID=1763537 RepID=A0A167J3C2_9FLAO|nr:hypothetical protein [Cochleicola gelatinilyticus]OAB80294.1 hypothetical protein ULVI_06040 [Cochleicola gelatinilyticus]
MKKKLRADIQMLAQQILSEEKQFDTASLKKVTANIYERLSILDFLETQIEGAENTQKVDKNEASLDSKSFREENWFTEPEPVPQPQHQDDLIEPLMEKIKDIVAQMPEQSQRVDELLAEVLPKPKYIKNDLEEFASNYQETPTFERKQPTKGGDVENTTKEKTFPTSSSIKTKAIESDDDKPKSLNDSINKGLNIGLNDRLAFIKHLFDDSTEDYTRVLSQINTMNTFEEAQAFIKGKVKPDYNYWLKKPMYEERFMAVVEKRFI